MASRKTTTPVSALLLIAADFDVGVLVKNANVKNNIFTVIFADGCVIEHVEPKVENLEKNVRDPKKSYAFQPESEPGNPRGISQTDDTMFRGPELITSNETTVMNGYGTMTDLKRGPPLESPIAGIKKSP
jgi:hypothetical protein